LIREAKRYGHLNASELLRSLEHATVLWLRHVHVTRRGHSTPNGESLDNTTLGFDADGRGGDGGVVLMTAH
jgi:hypothetical protein